MVRLNTPARVETFRGTRVCFGYISNVNFVPVAPVPHLLVESKSEREREKETLRVWGGRGVGEVPLDVLAARGFLVCIRKQRQHSPCLCVRSCCCLALN